MGFLQERERIDERKASYSELTGVFSQLIQFAVKHDQGFTTENEPFQTMSLAQAFESLVKGESPQSQRGFEDAQRVVVWMAKKAGLEVSEK